MRSCVLPAKVEQHQPNTVPHSNVFKFNLALHCSFISTEHHWSHMNNPGPRRVETLTATTTERSAELKYLQT